ncbi:hypothetical protein WCLP8_4930003 [uncultured Gammaproteobacteria bacterium]
MTDAADRWTVRGISRTAQRTAADLAVKADVTLGQLITRLIEQAADSADVPPGALVGLRGQIEAIYAKLSDKADVAAVDGLALRVLTLETRLPRPHHRDAIEENGTVAGVVQELAGMAETISGTKTGNESQTAPSESQNGRTGHLTRRRWLTGETKAERNAEIHRRRADGQSVKDVAAALGLSRATVVRAGACDER